MATPHSAGNKNRVLYAEFYAESKSVEKNGDPNLNNFKIYHNFFLGHPVYKKIFLGYVLFNPFINHATSV